MDRYLMTMPLNRQWSFVNPWSVLILLLLATPGWAQTTRAVLQIPVNFQNDTSQPRTLAQLKADGDAIVTMFYNNSYGAVTATSTVWGYITLPVDKGCVNVGRMLPQMNMTNFWASVEAALAARGVTYRRFGNVSGFNYTYIVVPAAFGKCSHDDQLGLAIDSPVSAPDHLTRITWRLGLPLALNWLCRAAPGSSTYVTLSAFCGPSPSTAGGRNITSHPGQGSGGLSAQNRHQLGWLPANQQLTVTETSGRWTLTRLENFAAGLKRLLIPAMGIELEYHAPGTSRSWDTSGVTGHVMNTSYRIDFTPDDRWIFGTTALAPGASWAYNDLRLTVLSADLNTAVVELRPSPAPSGIAWVPTGPAREIPSNVQWSHK